MESKGDVPKLLVAAVVTRGDGLVLLSRHAPYWKWHLPDGMVRFGDSFAETLLSSFAQDFGISIRLSQEHPWLVTETVNATRQVHYVTHHFRAEISGDPAGIADRPDMHVLWVDPSAFMEASSEHMLRSTAKALHKIVADAEPD